MRLTQLIPLISKKRFKLFSGFLLSSVLALLAYRHRSLSRSGVVGSIITGTTTLGMGGWSWGSALVFFFVSSSFLSHFRARDKEVTAADKFSKGVQRDILQVAANGGVATALALGAGLTTSPTLRSTLRAGYAGALATATADTWATELGVLSLHPPRLITNGKLTSPGTSGGVTLMGTGAATAGATLLGLFFWLLQSTQQATLALPCIASISGLLGSLFDSLLGATLQAMYYCPTCQKETEQQVHNCGTETHVARGKSWITNDMVNFLATLFGALLAMLLHILPFSGRRTHLL